MLDPNTAREERLLLPIVTSPAVSGRVLVLGRSPFAVSAFVNNPAVREVIYVPGALGGGEVSFANRDARAKLHVVGQEVNPRGVLRRDIGVDFVDYLFLDGTGDPWCIGREQHVKARSKEFRPRAVGYRYQELDVAACWIAAGCKLDEITASAFATFAAETGIIVAPSTTDYAERCAALAVEYAGRTR